MMMSFRQTATAALAFISLAVPLAARAQQDQATPPEVVQKVRQAARDLAKSGEAGLATFSGKNATSVWKDSYIFVITNIPNIYQTFRRRSGPPTA